MESKKLMDNASVDNCKEQQSKNCFAIGKNGCSILNITLCKNGKCPFYKSKMQYEAEREKYPIMDYSAEKKKAGICNGKANDT